MKTEDKIAQAMDDWFQMSFTYEGEYYVVNPFTIGISHEGINTLSASVETPETKNLNKWKYFNIEEISNLEETKTPFRLIIGYNTDDPYFIKVTHRLPSSGQYDKLHND